MSNVASLGVRRCGDAAEGGAKGHVCVKRLSNWLLVQTGNGLSTVSPIVCSRELQVVI